MNDATRAIRVLVVDDEPLARATLRVLLAADHEVTLVGECNGGDAALTQIRESDPDLVFLDVQMPGRGGFEVIAALGEARRAEVVFVTAFDAHAVKAFDVQALDYLLKPFDDDRFALALTRAKARVRETRLEQMVRAMSALVEPCARPALPAPAPARIAVRSAGSVTLVDVADLDYVEAEDYYVLLHVGAESHLHREPMRDLEQRLPASFVRIHRSYLVNGDRIRELRQPAGGEAHVVLRSGATLPVSRSGRRRLEELLAGGRF